MQLNLQAKPATRLLLSSLCFTTTISAQTTETSFTRETVLDSVSHAATGPLRDVPTVSPPDSTVRVTKRRISVDGAFLHVQEQGAGVPLVLIPGGPGNTLQSFHPHFSRAARFARVIYYDPRGVGQSDWLPGDGYSVEQAISDLNQLRKALGIDRWIVLGHSFGGLIAQLYAIHHPESVAGLVLVSSSSAFSTDLGDSDGRSFMLPEERDRVRAIYSRNGSRIVPVHSDGLDLLSMRRLLYNALRNGDWKRQYFYRPTDHKMARIATHEWLHDKDFNRLLNQSAFRYQLDGAFTGMPIQCLIIEGRWDQTWGSEKPRRFAQHLPGCRLILQERSAHFPFAEEPERFFSELDRFIRKVQLPSPDRLEQWSRGLVRWRRFKAE
ncbi:MAG TPA: alpha/beta hydrolase [Gemmatimonadales bacterium]|nr:alpha/beta hydrolase [Gemmatimonadales bacterium]